jgi:hypothetical protein
VAVVTDRVWLSIVSVVRELSLKNWPTTLHASSGLKMRFIEKAAAAASKVDPSWNLTPSRILNVHVLGAFWSQLVASAGFSSPVDGFLDVRPSEMFERVTTPVELPEL